MEPEVRVPVSTKIKEVAVSLFNILTTWFDFKGVDKFMKIYHELQTFTANDDLKPLVEQYNIKYLEL